MIGIGHDAVVDAITLEDLAQVQIPGVGHMVIEGVTSTGATGTGNFVFDGSPILVTPNIGTPSAGVLTNCTGLPYGGGGTGAASFTNHGVVVAGASALSTVAPSTNGNVLTSNGTDWTSAAAAGGSGGWVKIAQVTASAQATVDFTSQLSSTYDAYVVTITNVIISAGSGTFRMRIGESGTYKSDGAYAYVTNNLNSTVPLNTAGASGSDTGFSVSVAVLNTACNGNGIVWFYGASNSAVLKFAQWQFSCIDSGGTYNLDTGSGTYTTNNTAIDSLRFFFSANNIASGTLTLYGIAK